MSSIIAIGDIHGRDIWKEIVSKESDAEKIIFIGDYWDSFDVPFEEQLKNFMDILEFKRSNPEQVVLLLGNHDFHYIYPETYSGYQDIHAPTIKSVLNKAIKDEIIQICYENDEFIFSHAGITDTWYHSNYNLGNEENSVSLIINTFFKHHPKLFKFTPSNPLDNSGDSITQSPIWVRPRALQSDMIDGFIQVVGHTHQENIGISEELILIDTFDHCREYLIINDGVPSVGSI